MNLAMLLEMTAEAAGAREALVCGGERWTHADLLGAARAGAARLRGAGAQRVAFLDVAGPALPVALFASAWAGLPFVPLSYRRSEDELAALLARVAPCWLVAPEGRAARLARPGVRPLAPRALCDARGAQPAAEPWPEDPEAPALWLFTSGTTGAPKAAVLRQRHLVSYVLGSVEFLSAAEDDATLVAVPPYHVAGVAALLTSVYAGRRVVQLPEFDAAAWLALAAREGVSHAFVVPTMLARIVAALEAGAAPPARLRALAYGGGPMPPALIERALRLLPRVEFTNAYGLTETSSTLTLLGPREHRDALAAAAGPVRRRLASVGRPLPGVEIEIRDAAGRRLPPGERGEVFARGGQVAGEYAEGGSALSPDGFFPTRDAGWLDAEGYLFVEGRLDDVIVRGGENLSPGEIEDALLDHPAVRECAVVGVPDAHWGEAVAAAVVLRPGAAASADALCAWVRERLRSSRVPSRVVFLAELPYGETGKLLRRRVREVLAAAAPA